MWLIPTSKEGKWGAPYRAISNKYPRTETKWIDEEDGGGELMMMMIMMIT